MLRQPRVLQGCSGAGSERRVHLQEAGQKVKKVEIIRPHDAAKRGGLGAVEDTACVGVGVGVR